MLNEEVNIGDNPKNTGGDNMLVILHASDSLYLNHENTKIQSRGAHCKQLKPYILPSAVVRYLNVD